MSSGEGEWAEGEWEGKPDQLRAHVGRVGHENASKRPILVKRYPPFHKRACLYGGSSLFSHFLLNRQCPHADICLGADKPPPQQTTHNEKIRSPLSEGPLFVASGSALHPTQCARHLVVWRHRNRSQCACRVRNYPPQGELNWLQTSRAPCLVSPHNPTNYTS